MKTIRFSLLPSPPFRLDLTVWILRRRSANRIDLWDGSTYFRAILLDSQKVLMSVTQNGPPTRPELEVSLTCENPSPGVEKEVKNILERVLGLHINLDRFYALASKDVHLGPLVEKFRGVKPPRYYTLYETIANGIVCQQLSLNSAISILNRLAHAYGTTFQCAENSCFSFPEARSMAALEPEEVKSVGLTKTKARALVEAARAITRKSLNHGRLENMDNDSVFAELVKLWGIGGWTADYVLLRGLGRLDIFPRGDSGALGNLNRWLRPGEKLPDSDLGEILSKWRGYAGLVYFHLLLRGLANSGFIA